MASLGAEALMRIARAYEFGHPGVNVNAPKALEIYKMAAHLGDPDAHFELSMAYMNDDDGAGHEVQKDSAKSILHFKKAVAVGGCIFFGHVKVVVPEDGVGVIVTTGGTEVFLCDAPREKWLLTYAHEHGIRGVEVDEAKALELYEDAAKLGDPDAMMKLAWAYSTGRDLVVEEDKEKALMLYEETAALEDPDAQWTLEDGYKDGDFGEVDKVKALELYRLAAGNGNSDALVRLAKAHSPGGNLGVEVDDTKVTELKAKALEVYRLAAKDGDSYALLRLAKAHLPDGDLGVDADDAEAIGLFKEVAELGGGEVNSGILGVDSLKAMELFKEAFVGMLRLLVEKSNLLKKTTAKGSGTITPWSTNYT